MPKNNSKKASKTQLKKGYRKVTFYKKIKKNRIKVHFEDIPTSWAGENEFFEMLGFHVLLEFVKT